MIEPALSILVDGDSIREAAVVYSDGRVYCYPCVNGGIEYLNEISSLVFSLINSGLLRFRRDYLILYMRGVNIIIIPLNERSYLMLSANPKYVARRLVKGFIKSLNKLYSLAIGAPVSFRDESEEFINRRKVPREERVVLDLGEELSTDSIRRLKTDFRVVKEIVRFHKKSFSKLRYRKVELGVGENTLHVIPLGEAHLALTELQDCIPGNGAMINA